MSPGEHVGGRRAQLQALLVDVVGLRRALDRLQHVGPRGVEARPLAADPVAVEEGEQLDRRRAQARLQPPTDVAL